MGNEGETRLFGEMGKCKAFSRLRKAFLKKGQDLVCTGLMPRLSSVFRFFTNEIGEFPCNQMRRLNPTIAAEKP